VANNVRIEMEGLRVGSWLVGKKSHQSSSGNWYWHVTCDCGTKKTTSGTLLRTNKSNKCHKCAGKINGRLGLNVQAKNKTVYFIQCGNYFKIGVSDDVERRVRDLESSNPYEINLLDTDTSTTEEDWHKIFSHRHHRGEWYIGNSCEIV